MEHAQEMSVNVELADSMNAVEFDAERNLFQATYDSGRDSTCLAVLAVVASALGKDPLALPPLQSVIDTDTLERLITESSIGQGDCTSISFCYEELEVTVYGEGRIEVASLENT